MKIAVTFAIALAAASTSAGAQGLTAVRPIDGYECRRLQLTREQVVNPDKYIPVYRGPSTETGEIGAAMAIVMVRMPANRVNGLVEILFPDGRPGWIRADIVRPYATSEHPNARCTPSIMSNGRPGFG